MTFDRVRGPVCESSSCRRARRRRTLTASGSSARCGVTAWITCWDEHQGETAATRIPALRRRTTASRSASATALWPVPARAGAAAAQARVHGIPILGGLHHRYGTAPGGARLPDEILALDSASSTSRFLWPWTAFTSVLAIPTTRSRRAMETASVARRAPPARHAHAAAHRRGNAAARLRIIRARTPRRARDPRRAASSRAP
jgi:hypothetical protein